MLVHRNFSASGAVSVTVTQMAGTATPGDDFGPEPVTVSWGDGVSTPITVAIAIHDDVQREEVEEFTVELSNPTGGAIVGPRSTASISIAANDQPAGRSVGGRFGYLSLLLFGATAIRAGGSPIPELATRLTQAVGRATSCALSRSSWARIVDSNAENLRGLDRLAHGGCFPAGAAILPPSRGTVSWR